MKTKYIVTIVTTVISSIAIIVAATINNHSKPTSQTSRRASFESIKTKNSSQDSSTINIVNKLNGDLDNRKSGNSVKIGSIHGNSNTVVGGDYKSNTSKKIK